MWFLSGNAPGYGASPGNEEEPFMIHRTALKPYLNSGIGAAGSKGHELDLGISGPSLAGNEFHGSFRYLAGFVVDPAASRSFELSREIMISSYGRNSLKGVI